MGLRRKLEEFGIDAADIEPMGGGCVSAVYLVRLKQGGRIVAKVDETGAASLPVEAFMLRYLRDNTSLPVPEVLHAADSLLLMEYIPGESLFDSQAERHAADLLHALHAISSPHYGFEQDTLIGGLRQPNTASLSWVDFFRHHRLLYMAMEGMRTGRLPQTVYRRLESLSEHLADWLFEPEAPSLIHGDVWTTNILAVRGRITSFLDPAIYFAHNEMELAFTRLFRTFSPDFYARYGEYRPIASGFFEERCDIYNLYPLLVHVRLFGGSYVSSVTRVLERFGF
jgi:fructosamine-3-kinase